MDQSLLEKVFNSEEYSDCAFVFPNEEGKIIKGHRAILANAIPRVRKLFEDAQKQMNEGCVIEINDVESVVFKNFLRFVYCKTIDWSFEECVKLYDVSSKYNCEDGKTYFKEVFSREKPAKSNVQNSIQLLEFALAINDQSLLELSSKKLLIDYDLGFETVKFPPQLFDKALRCLNTDKILKKQPMKLLSTISRFTFFNEYELLDEGRVYNATLESFCWEKANQSEIMESSVLNDDQKVKFLVRSIEGNSTKNDSKTKNNDFRQCNYYRPYYQSKKYLKSSESEEHHKMVNDSVAKLGSLYTKQNHTDCTFVFPNDKTLKAHKFTLSLASPVFEAMFYGDLKEGDSVEIVDIKEIVFHLFLKIIYLIDVDLAVEPSRTIYNLYAVAHKYQCLDALNLIRANINTRRMDAFLFYELSQLYDDKAIEEKCLENLIDPLYALDTDFFLDASPQTICTVYKANTVDTVFGTKKLVEKLEQYIEVNNQNNPEIESQIQEAIKGIRFSELEIVDILKTFLLPSKEKLPLVQLILSRHEASLDSDDDFHNYLHELTMSTEEEDYLYNWPMSPNEERYEYFDEYEDEDGEVWQIW